MKIKPGQTCAVCVKYSDTDLFSWIITKFEKKSVNGKYIVKDEFADNPNFERYTVEPNRIIPFPILDEKYTKDEDIIALWYDSENKEWSTMFYDAKIIDYKLTNQVTIKYSGYDNHVIIDKNKISKYPEGFDLIPENEEEIEQKEEEINNNISEEKKIHFLLDRPPLQKDKPDFKPLTDEEFTKLSGSYTPPPRLKVIKGTPLIDFLQDPILFPNSSPHITSNGYLKSKNISNPLGPSILLKENVKCGRISKILFDWRN